MTSTSQNAYSYNSISATGPQAVSDSVESTLRLIARLPVPEGLERRVISGLNAAPRAVRVLHWPAALHPSRSWMRGAAAAAIVFVVAGGGWGVYTRVQPSQPARVLVMPPRAGAGGGFSSAGAMRTPQTLNGPMVANPIAAQSNKDQAANSRPAQVKPLNKALARTGPMTHARAQAVAPNKASAQPAVSAAK
jgi:hypothetical protein